MNLHERQWFDHLLLTAADRFAERIVQRCAGADRALEALRLDPDGEGVWASQFTDAVFADFLLDNVDGACFVLAALERRAFPDLGGGAVAQGAGPTVGAVLDRAARRAFTELLVLKTEQALDRSLTYGGVA